MFQRSSLRFILRTPLLRVEQQQQVVSSLGHSAQVLSPLALCLDVIRHRKLSASLSTDDVFKICSIFALPQEDPLDVKADLMFLSGLWYYFQKIDAAAVQPFQRSFIETAFNKLGPHGAAAMQRVAASLSVAAPLGDGVVTDSVSSSPSTAEADSDSSIEERIGAIYEIMSSSREARFLGADDARRVAKHCEELKLVFRKMNGNQVYRLLGCLATIHFQDYNFISVLARRCCELAPKWDGSSNCRVLHNLIKLNVQDSLVAILQQIDVSVQHLTMKDILNVLHALERQPNTSAAAAKLMPKLLTRAVAVLGDAELAGFHRAALTCAAKYSLSRHAAIITIVNDLQRFSDQTLIERDVVPLLQSFVDLKVPFSTPGVTRVLAALERLATNMDVRLLDTVMDVLSVFPCDSTATMDVIMQRFSNECAKLTSPAFVNALETISSYPPAKNHACMASFAFAANTMRDTFDAEGLERMILSLTSAEQFSDDFYALCEFAQGGNKHGLARDAKALLEFLSRMPSSSKESKNPKMVRVITRAVETVAPFLVDEDVTSIRKELARIGVQDPHLQQKLFGRVRQLAKESGARAQQRYRRGYDPVDDL